MAHIPKPTQGQPILGKRIKDGKITYKAYSNIGAKFMGNFGFKKCDYTTELAAQKASKPSAKPPESTPKAKPKETFDIELVVTKIKAGKDTTVKELLAVIGAKKLKINKSQPKPTLMEAVKAAF